MNATQSPTEESEGMAFRVLLPCSILPSKSTED